MKTIFPITYEVMKSHDIDPLGEVSGKYKETSLVEVFTEVFPDDHSSIPTGD